MKKTSLKTIPMFVILSLALGQTAFAAEVKPKEDVQTYALDTLVVTATRTEKKITDAKADISVVTRQEIEDKHLGNVQEALRTVPGVQFLDYGGSNMNFNLEKVLINGSDNILVLVDGVRISDFLGGAGASGAMNASLLKSMDNIEKIEVLRGSASTIYGSGAQGGVINIITRKIDSNSSTIDISKGSYQRENYNFFTQGRKDKVAYKIYYNKNKRGDISDAEGKTWPGKLDGEGVGGAISYDFSDNNRLKISYNKSDTDMTWYDYTYDQVWDPAYLRTNDITIQHDYEFNDRLKNKLSYRKASYHQYGDSTMGGLHYYTFNDDYGYTFLNEQLSFEMDRYNIVLGADYSKGEDNNSKHEMKNLSTYIQGEWEFVPRIHLAAGIRHDSPEGVGESHKVSSNNAKSYKLSFDVTDKDKLYAGRNEYFILPGINQLYSGKFGNSSLLPAIGKTDSIGYSHQFNDNNSFMLNWFYTKGERSIGMDNEGVWQNYNNEVQRGWNAQWTGKLDENWNLNAGWAHLFHHASDASGAPSSLDYGFYPKDMATVGLTYHNAKWTVDLTGRYFFRSDDAESLSHRYPGFPADNYPVFNLAVTNKAAKNFEIYGRIENLFNKLYAERTNVFWGEKESYYNMPGRSIMVGVKYSF